MPGGNAHIEKKPININKISLFRRDWLHSWLHETLSRHLCVRLDAAARQMLPAMFVGLLAKAQGHAAIYPDLGPIQARQCIVWDRAVQDEAGGTPRCGKGNPYPLCPRPCKMCLDCTMLAKSPHPVFAAGTIWAFFRRSSSSGRERTGSRSIARIARP